MSADGSIIIDTRIDTSGMSGAVIDVNSQFGKIGQAAIKTVSEINRAFDGIKTQGMAAGMSESFDTEGDEIQQILSDTERSAKSKAASIAAIYKQQGMSQSDAFKKAWEQIERSSSTGTEKVKKDLDGVGEKSKSVGGQLGANLSSGISGAARKIGSIIGTIFAVGEIIQFGQECIELGSDMQEVQNVVDTTFGSMSAEINEFAKNALQSFGLSELAAKQYTSTMGAMLKSMGFTVDEAADMSMELAGLAGDMASFYNLDTADAFAKIRSGISGETEPLKQLGINLSVANLEQYALTKGITKSYNAMTQQEQALLRYNYLLSVTSDAQGDFSDTSSSWANQTRILSEQFNSLKTTIGQGLINALTPVLGVINSILAALQKLATAFLQLTQLLFGDAGGFGGASDGLGDLAESYNAAADAANNLAGGAAAAKKAINEFDNGLDEIKKFQDDSAGGSGGGAGGGTSLDFATDSALGNALDQALGDFSPEIEALAITIKDVLFDWEDLTGEQIVEKLIAGLATIAGASTGFVIGGVPGAIVGALVGLSLAIWFDNVTFNNDGKLSKDEIIDSLVVALGAIGGAVLGFTVGGPGGAAIGMAIGLGVSFYLTTSQVNVDDALTNWDGLSDSEKISTILIGLDTGYAPIDFVLNWDEATASLEEDFTQYFLQPLTTLSTEAWAAVLEDACNYWEGVLETYSGVATWFYENVIQPVTGFFTEMWGSIFSSSSDSWANTQGVFSGVAAWFNETVVRPISEFFSGLWGGFSSGASDSWAGGVKPIFEEIIGYISGVFYGDWESAWNSLGEMFGGLWAGFVDLVRDPVNEIISLINELISGAVSGINSVIGALNGVSFTIPEWVPVYGGSKFGLNIGYVSAPQIPYLAKGAVIPPNAPFMAVLGDQRNGTNLETPESLLRKIVREESGSQRGGGQYQFTAQINRRTLFDEMITEAQLRKIQSGRNPFEL